MSHKTISSLVAVFGLVVSPWTLAQLRNITLILMNNKSMLRANPLNELP